MLKIVCDNREQQPYSFSPYDCTTTNGTLATGDYSLAGFENMAAVERKSLSDLVGSLTQGRKRFERELQRAKGFDLFALVIEANHSDIAQHKYRSKATPQSVLQSLAAFTSRYRLPIIFAGNRAAAEYWVYSLLEKFLKEKQKEFKAIQAHTDTS